MATLAIIHTTSATVAPLMQLAQETLPGCGIINFVDDSILPALTADAAESGAIEERVVQYARFAEQAGAAVILEACSSIGELVPQMQRATRVPVVRIDQAMAEAAVRGASTVGVAATLATTLQPTARLLQTAARAAGARVDVRPQLVNGAYELMRSGDFEGHDRLVAEALRELAARTDKVVLAQASMARVLDRLPEALRVRCLTSPRPAMERIKTLLAEREK